jgi:glycine oxidase
MADLGMQMEVAPVRGQMILFRAEPGVLQHIVLHHDRYLIPRRDGRILVGSTLEYTGFEKETTAEALEALRAFALEMLPALKDYPVEHHWAGLRPGSPAGIPYISEHPEIDGLYVNAGHFRNGVVLGPASAHVMASLITGAESDIGPLPYGLDQHRSAG